MAEAGRLPKPMMRGLFQRQLKIHVSLAIACGLLGGLAWKVFYMDPRKVAYEKWRNYYDPVIHEKILIEAGLLQSAPK